MNKQDLLKQLGTSLPSYVDADSKKELKVEHRKIAIATDSIQPEDGFYFIEPTLMELVKIRKFLLDIDPETTDTALLDTILHYIIEKMSNVKFGEESTPSVILEVEQFIANKIGNGFFYSNLLGIDPRSLQETNTTGSTKESD